MRKINKLYVKITTFIDIANQGIKNNLLNLIFYISWSDFNWTCAEKLKQLPVAHNQAIICNHYCFI